MAAQKQKNTAVQNEKYTQLQKKIKRKTIKSKSEYASKASPTTRLISYYLKKIIFLWSTSNKTCIVPQ